MSDIVERLRERANDPRYNAKPYNLLLDAADAIEERDRTIQRLRDELASARASQDLLLVELRKIFALIMAGDDAEAITAAIRAEATREGSEG